MCACASVCLTLSIPLPSLLSASSQRVCYKTSVYQCDYEYRVYLNQRNFTVLQNQCPEESDDLRTALGNTKLISSPRYACTRINTNRLMKYRKSDFCLYNISISDCPSHTVIVKSSRGLQRLQERDEASGRCRDYLQFYTDQFSERYCGSELTGLDLLISSDQFMAVFWTDSANNAPGFELTASCAVNTAP